MLLLASNIKMYKINNSVYYFYKLKCKKIRNIYDFRYCLYNNTAYLQMYKSRLLSFTTFSFLSY